jgi:hypothetical protein
MKRFQLFEFTEMKFLPGFLRRGITDYLDTTMRLTKLHALISPLIKQAISDTGYQRLIFLGAGSGGGIQDFLQTLPEQARIELTDLYPVQNFQSFSQRVVYDPRSIDASNVPNDLQGIRVLQAIFHHLPPHLGQKVIDDAVATRAPLLIFEATHRSISGFVGMSLVPFLVLLFTPFMRPLRLSNLVFTYVIPLLPVLITWDGFVSSLRTYTVDELKFMTAAKASYTWDIGYIKAAAGVKVTYLYGKPKAPKSGEIL